MKIKIFSLIIIAFVFVFCNSENQEKQQQSGSNYFLNRGPVYGTTYSIKYEYHKDLLTEIQSELKRLDLSLSSFNKQSIISKLNRNEKNVELDDLFVKLYQKSVEVSKNTLGAFDLTVAPLVNAYGFGFENKDSVTQKSIDSLLEITGYQKVKLSENRIVKDNPNIKLDASAIAKGFAVDLVCELFEKYQIQNYMVEIGGEVRAKGKNNKGEYWRIGIDKPIEDPEAVNRKLQAVVSLKNKAIATSGNYRRFYVKNGVKYSHTINPKTGMPAKNKLLSASVIANDCMTADAYATGFMVLGLEESIKLSEKLPQLDVYLIYYDAEDNMNKIFVSAAFESEIKDL